MHTIRLRGPWEVAPLADSPGTTRCIRRFHKPTGLDAGERVWLVIEELPGQARVSLNAAPIAEVDRNSTRRLDITPLLRPHNELAIDVACPADSDLASCLNSVRLEIVEGNQ